MKIARFGAFAFLTVVLSASALAQKVDDEPTLGPLIGTVSDGAVTYEYTSFGGTDAANTNLMGASGGDDLFENWFFFRVDGDTQEFPFPDPDTADYTGDTVTFTWADVGGRGLFSAELVETVSDGGGPSGSVLSTLTLTNISGSPLTVDVFAFADIDLGGSFGGDNATLTNSPDFISLSDGADTGEYRAGGNDNFQVLAFPGLDPVLSDASVDDLDDSGLPFGPGDYTGAFQWSGLMLAADQGVTLQRSIAINEAAPVPNPPEFTGGPIESTPVPAMGMWGLLALGLVLVAIGVIVVRARTSG